jgi:hypothetical protein
MSIFFLFFLVPLYKEEPNLILQSQIHIDNLPKDGMKISKMNSITNGT